MAKEREIPLIQVVDDEPAMRMRMRTALEMAGFAVAETEGGRQALAIFEELRPDGVLLDAVMPELDGLVTCRQMRRLDGGKHTPILVMTEGDDFEAIHQAFQAGATDFVTKPVDGSLLGYRVRYLVRAGRTFNALRRSRDRLAAAQQIAKLGHWEIDLENRLFHCSGEAGRLLGLEGTRTEWDQEVFLRFVHPEDREEIRLALEKVIRQAQPYEIFYRVVLPGGDEHILCNQGEVLADFRQEPAAVVGTVQDVTEIRKTRERIHFLAFYDELTGLANRHLFNDRLNKALDLAVRHRRQGALLVLDLDRFTRINETLGHGLGDRLLKEIAQRLLGGLRRADAVGRSDSEEAAVCVSRFGGDQFTILLSEIRDYQDAAKVAQRLLEMVKEPCCLGGHEIYVTTSIGISIFPFDGIDVETLLKNAETALHHVKEEGKNGYRFFEVSMNAGAWNRLALENDLRRALVRGEFILYFQPQVLTGSGRITGAEALVRWQHPEWGLVSPEEFIPIAEESGLIVPLGEWVLQAACEQARAWQAGGQGPIRVAVNLSGRQFRQEAICDVVARALQESRFDPHLLELEFTETILMDNAEKTQRKLSDLKGMGVQVAIDDFGTGYSSLNYLRHFPIDRLKIDRSFVRDITERTEGASAIIEAIVALARSLKLQVLAEGVETREQLVFLRALGCTEIQGFYCSRPVPAEVFPELLRRGTLP